MDGTKMFAEISCQCGHKLGVLEDGTNKKLECPNCGRVIKVEGRSENKFTDQLSSKDSPPPGHTIEETTQKIRLPDEGLSPDNKSILSFSSDMKVRAREAANLVSRGKIIEAIALYRWLCEENPEHRDAYYGLGFCYYKLGDLHRSKWMLEKAMELQHPTASKLHAKVLLKIEELQHTSSTTDIRPEEGKKEIGDFALDATE